MKSKEEALEWLKRAPFQEGDVEIRPIFEAADLAASDPTGEIMKQEERLRRFSTTVRNGRQRRHLESASEVF